ncbi:MAG: hypothetical protein IJ160_13520 [Muribaculaceae bacterium]|nr:hypothetical protein [Muribaculaceae bacterium]
MSHKAIHRPEGTAAATMMSAWLLLCMRRSPALRLLTKKITAFSRLMRPMFGRLAQMY